MLKILYGLIALWMFLSPVTSSEAQVSIGIGLPNVSIGINLPLYPELARVPGYPVYYAPRLDANYFFYDGMYWVYQDDYWYASSWYNGPWALVEPYYVPLYILRIPVRYYQQPPVYFREWQPSAPPRWGQHWGHDWEQHRRGWDHWKRSSAPAPAPLPVYQRQYTGDRYPRVEQQHTLRSQSYRYQPRDKVVRQHFKQQAVQKAPADAQRGRQEAPAVRSPKQQEPQHSTPRQKQVAPSDPRSQPAQRVGDRDHVQKPDRDHNPPQQRAPEVREQKQQPKAAQPHREQQAPEVREQKQQPRAAQPHREQQAPRVKDQEQRQQDRGDSQEPNRGHGQGRDKDEERGRGRDK